MARVGLERSPKPLADWCQNLNADYLLVPPRSRLPGLVTLGAPELVPALRKDALLTRKQADRTLVRMMVFGSDEPPFQKVFDREDWRIYSLAVGIPGAHGPEAAPLGK